MVFLPVSVYAETYSLGGTDMSIDVDDSLWYVFTRDNIKDNSELKELGISYNSMYDILYTNEAYMDALLLYEDGGFVELFVRKKTLEKGIVNLSNYEDAEVLDLAKAIAKKRGGRVSAQAVGGAVGWNPICIIIPCHRVIGADGRLTGYGGGLANKVSLLAHGGLRNCRMGHGVRFSGRSAQERP